MQAKMAEIQRADTNRDGVLSVVDVTQFNMRREGCRHAYKRSPEVRRGRARLRA
jgi:hypothetical protein